MTAEQITPSAAAQALRAAATGLALIAFAGGTLSLVAPLVGSEAAWRWDLGASVANEPATINARVVARDEGGIRLARQGRRPVSVISPPLALPRESPRIFRVTAAYPLADRPEPATVRVLWQTRPAEEFEYEETSAVLGPAAAQIDFSLPVAPERIHRLGVQFPDADGIVLVRAMELPALSAFGRLGVAARQLLRPEPIANHSVNFVRGPSILGRRLNYFLVSILVAVIGGHAFVRLASGRRPTARFVVAAVAVLWLASDVVVTAGLCRQVAAEVPRYRGRPRADQIAAMYGPEIAWAGDALVKHCPPGGTFAVLSDDRFAPAHRLAYLLTPARARVDAVEGADLIVVIFSRTSRFADGALRVGDRAPVATELVARHSAYVYLLRRRVR